MLHVVPTCNPLKEMANGILLELLVCLHMLGAFRGIGGTVHVSSNSVIRLVQVSSCSNTGSMRDDPYCTSRKNS